MKTLLCAVCAFFMMSSITHAQGAQATWDQSGVTSPTQAQSFVYKLYVTPAGATQSLAPVTLTSVLCGGSTTTVQCSSVIPSGSPATLTGARSVLTATDPVSGVESTQSSPFTKPAAVPSNLKITP